jgi:hypothetical protein
MQMHKLDMQFYIDAATPTGESLLISCCYSSSVSSRCQACQAPGHWASGLVDEVVAAAVAAASALQFLRLMLGLMLHLGAGAHRVNLKDSLTTLVLLPPLHCGVHVKC